jgi:hypothetical protein
MAYPTFVVVATDDVAAVKAQTPALCVSAVTPVQNANPLSTILSFDELKIANEPVVVAAVAVEID